MSRPLPGWAIVAVCIALVAFIIAGQAVAFSVAPQQQAADPQAVMGRAGFAYLSGLRTFGAATLWNRIEPQFHTYYTGRVALTKMKFMLPTMYLVVALDPQFEQAYYVASYIVSQGVSPQAGIDLAKQGVDANPDSGLLRANLAQLLFQRDETGLRAEVMANVEAALSAQTTWANDEDRFEAYAILAQIVGSYGDTKRADALHAEQDRMKQAGIGAGDHDHDHDGKQDH